MGVIKENFVDTFKSTGYVGYNDFIYAIQTSQTLPNLGLFGATKFVKQYTLKNEVKLSYRNISFSKCVLKLENAKVDLSASASLSIENCVIDLCGGMLRYVR